MAGTTDTVKAKLTPGEFVIRKEAVDMIGVPMLNKLNDMPEEGGHSAIDNLIQRATLANMKMMYGGGMVQPNYAGGGMVEEKMYGYQNGGKIQELMEGLQQEQQYTMGAPDYGTNIFGQKISEPYEFNPEDFSPIGGVLKRLSRVKSGLAPKVSGKVPRVKGKARKAIDEMYEKAEDEFAGVYQRGEDSLSELYRIMKDYGLFQQGGVVKDKMKGYENGGSIYGMNRTPEGMMQAVYEMPTDDGNRYYLGEALRPQLNLSRQVARSRAEEKAMNMPQDSISFDMVQQLLNPEAAEPEGKKGLMGLLGFENGGPVNQMPEMLSQQAEALQSGMDQDTTNRARKALQYIKIQTLMNDPTLSKQSYTEFEGEVPSEVADIAKHFYSTVRDSANARALRGMQGHSGGYSPSIYGPR